MNEGVLVSKNPFLIGWNGGVYGVIDPHKKTLHKIYFPLCLIIDYICGMEKDSVRVVNGDWVYDVYSDGRVWNGVKGCWCKLHDNNGYLQLFVRMYSDVHRWEYLHRVVWSSFRGKIPSNLEVDHLDGDRSNNRLENLEVVTHAENCRRRESMLRHKHGDNWRKVVYGRHWMEGRTHSDVTKQKMSRAKVGDKHPKFTGYIYVDLSEFSRGNLEGTGKYGSYGEAARELGTYPKKIERMVASDKYPNTYRE